MVETLVADAGALRTELAAVERESAELEERRSAAGGEGDPTGPGTLVDAEAALAVAEQAWREAEAEAGRWQARAEALGQALDSARAAVDMNLFTGIDGIEGSLVDHLQIEAGAEAAVAAALGDAMHALVVDGDATARNAVALLASGNASALLLVLDRRDTAVTTGATVAPEGARSLASCVRSALPGLQATLARLLAGVVLADGDWRSAVDLAIDNPDLTVMTRGGDRFGGPGLWRVGGTQASGITRAALEEAEEQKVRAAETRTAAETAVTMARTEVEEQRRRIAAVAGVHRELEMRARDDPGAA